MGVRLLDLVKKALDLPIERSFIWTDAHAVLYWLTSTDKRFGTYVMARISSIRAATSPEQWRYVPSQDNPADWATKVVCSDPTAKLWIEGPEFIRCSENKWPVWKRVAGASVAGRDQQCFCNCSQEAQRDLQGSLHHTLASACSGCSSGPKIRRCVTAT